jgi:WD40 repeat protein
MVWANSSGRAQDVAGTSLPEGAIARVGAFQLRHQAVVHQLTFLPNGFLSALDARGSFRVWDPSTGNERRLFVMPGVQGDSREFDQYRRMDMMRGQFGFAFRNRDSSDNGPPVPQESVSPDGRILAVASADTVILQDTTTGKVLRQLALTPPRDKGEAAYARLRGGLRTPLAFSADGKHLAAGNGLLGGLQVFDVDSGRQIHELHPPRGRKAFRLLFVPSMGHLVGLCGDAIVVWELKTGKRIRTYLSGRESMTAMAVSPDGRRFATAHEGGAIRFWDERSEEETGTITNEAAGRTILSLAFSPDGSTLAAGDSEDNLRLYDTGSLKESKLLKGHHDTVTAIAFSADSKIVASADITGRIRIWDIAKGKEAIKVDSLHGIQHVAVQGQKVLLGGSNGVVRHADLSTGKVLQRFKGPEVLVNPVYSADAKMIVHQIPDRDSAPQLWDVVNEKHVPLKGIAPASSFIFSPDGRRLMLSHGDDNVLQMWDPKSGEMVSVLGKNCEALAFSPDGRTLLIEEVGGFLSVWELAAGKFRVRIPNLSVGRTLAVSANGRQLANATSEIVRLWSLTTGKVERALAAHSAMVSALAYSPDGTRLASGDRDGVILLWDLAKFQPLHYYIGHRDGVNCLAFSADGKVLVSGSSDGTAVVWDLEAAVANPVRREEARKMDALWAALASEEADAAYAAQQSLIAQGDAAVAQLRKGLSPVPAVAPTQIHSLIADLDDRRFPVREKAMQELTRLEGQAAPALRQALDAKPSSEIVKRVRELLDTIAKPVAPAEMLRQLRAIEILEQINTAQSRQLLQELGKGAVGARLTEEAKGALERMNARPVPR